jgi:hypothetical protein
VRLTVTGDNGQAEVVKSHFVVIGPLAAEREPNDTLATANDASSNVGPFSGPRFQLSLRGGITPGADVDFYTLGAMQPGDVITADLAGTGGQRATLPEALVSLYRLNGGSPVRVANDQDSGPGPDARLRFTVTTADAYFVVADSEDDVAGTYDLGLWLDNAGAAPATGGTFRQESGGNNDTAAGADNASTSWRPVVTLSTTVATIGSSGDIDNFRFQFNAGEVITVLSDSTSAASTRVRLRNAAGTVIAEDDRSNDGTLDSGVYAFTIPATGVYYVDVRAVAGTGAYAAYVYSSNAFPAALPLLPGRSPVRGDPEDSLVRLVLATT